jgi:hypothetical protein
MCRLCEPVDRLISSGEHAIACVVLILLDRRLEIEDGQACSETLRCELGELMYRRQRCHTYLELL